MFILDSEILLHLNQNKLAAVSTELLLGERRQQDHLRSVDNAKQKVCQERPAFQNKKKRTKQI